jgi:hypothetical protein
LLRADKPAEHGRERNADVTAVEIRVAERGEEAAAVEIPQIGIKPERIDPEMVERAEQRDRDRTQCERAVYERRVDGLPGKRIDGCCRIDKTRSKARDNGCSVPRTRLRMVAQRGADAEADHESGQSERRGDAAAGGGGRLPKSRG